MVSKKIVIKDELGLHMRPAGELAKKAAAFQSSIKIMYNDKAYDCKSLMLLMTACIKYNAEVELVCEGPDEEKALEELSAFLESDMGD